MKHFAVRLDDAAAGATYIISVNHKRYVFPAQVVSVLEDLTELNFTAEWYSGYR